MALVGTRLSGNRKAVRQPVETGTRVPGVWRWGALILLAVGLTPDPAWGQVYRQVTPPSRTLPPATVAPTLPGTFDPFGQTTGDKIQLQVWQTLDIPPGSWGDPGTWNPTQLNSTTIERFRKSFVQKTELSGGYVHRDGPDDLGYSYAAAGITMVVPLGSTDNLLVVTPRYRTDWISGPDTLDVPAQLHSAWVDIGWRVVFNSRWSTIVGVRPGVFTDFDAAENGFRLGGLGLVNYAVIPECLTVTLGVVYLDRNDTRLLPAAGLTWIPNPDTRLDLTFPKPKLSRRVSHLPYLLEDWVYVAASFGGGTWSVLRSSGADDELTLRDFRASVGFERMMNGGTGFHVDLGYVFGRRLEYEVRQTELEFPDTFVIEAGVSF